MKSGNQYAPPAHPPPKRPLLKSSTALPYPVDLEWLASRGWATLPIQNSLSDPLYHAFSELFEASAQFFSLPEEERMKYKVKPNGNAQVSEEGYSRVEGEKCMIALRKLRTTPSEFGMREKVGEAWRVSACVMRDVMCAIEEALGMESGVLGRTMESQLELPREGEGSVATLMRMFRYDRPAPPPPEYPSSHPPNANLPDAKVGLQPDSESTSRVVAEPHKDLGLLTIVIGHSPGLECWDAQSNTWVSCETSGEGLNATILVGQTLAKFTNMRFVAGRHRVFVHPSSSPSPSQKPQVLEDSSRTTSPLSSPTYRFSLVHALRAHLPLLVSSSDFETPITSPFPPRLRFCNASVSDIYKAISNAHWNVNISVEERRRQERILLERAEKERKREEKLEIDSSESGRKARTSGTSARFSRLLSVFRRSSRQSTSVS